MWREFMTSLSENCLFARPATSEEIALAAEALPLPMPTDIEDLLRESNGVAEQDEGLDASFLKNPDFPGYEKGDMGLAFLWDTEEMRTWNRHLREPDYAPHLLPRFERSVFFASSPGGDFIALEETEQGQIVIEWSHETMEDRILAESVRDFIVKRLHHLL